jgi:membrane glycosyltransferase
MSADITSGPDAIATGELPLLDQAYSIFTRRLFFGGLVGATCLVLAGWFASVTATGNSGPIEVLLLTLFVLNAPSLAIGFWNAALGFALLNGTRASGWAPAQIGFGGSDDALTARTAVAMVVRNEPPAGAFALLRTLVESLDRNGHLASFDFFILSDSDQPDVVAAEEAAFSSWRAEGGSSAQVFYRRRTQRDGFKPGNVYDFCESAGREYDLLVLLDSDSLMSGEVVVRLVRAMQANSRLGILQTFSVGLPSESLFARIFSFGHRHGMRCAAVGAAWWQGDCGQFWGHNCIIRMAPFIEHCRLPYLPGEPLADRNVVNCAGHDQVEAALMRRAGYEVRFLPEEGGSYEDNPPAAPEYLLRYGRWCQGNLENLKLLDLADLVPMSRFHLGFLAVKFLGAVGIVAFAILAAWAVATWPDGRAFPTASAAALYVVWLLLYFSPKLFGVGDALWRSRERFGGAARLLAGCLSEIVFTLLLAPVSMFAAGASIVALMLGRAKVWESQQREPYRLSWNVAIAELWPATLFGFALLAFLIVAAPHAVPWFLPFIAGLIFAVPFAVVTASGTLGAWAAARKLCAAPEEINMPEDVASVRAKLARSG